VLPIKPRAVTSQLDWPLRVHVLAEWLSEGSIEEAGRQAQAVMREQFPEARDVLDLADPAAFDRRANEHQSAADILRRTCGIHLRPGPRTITERLEGVRRWLLGVVPAVAAGEPMGKLLVDPSCARIKEGFRSGYHYRQLPGAVGRYHDIPFKNAFSHLMNALEYALGGLGAEADGHRSPEPMEPLRFDHPGLGALVGPGFQRPRPRSVWDA
jgi:hypothetical protein